MKGERGKEIVSGFKEFVKEPLLDIININNNLNHSATELWLIQFPLHHVQAHDLDNGKELSLTLHSDGVLGNFEGSSGKSYDVVSLTAPNPNATVFLSSAAAEPKIVGKISRYISLVHYPKPSELQKQNASSEKQKQASGTSLTNSSRHLANPTQSSKKRSSKSTSTHGSKHKSSLSESREPPNPKKRKPLEEKTRSTGQSTLDSGRGHSAVTSSGSLQHSSERKSKKNKKA